MKNKQKLENPCVVFNGISIDDIDGTREELMDLSSLLEEVIERAYKSNRTHFMADLAAVVDINSCEGCEKRVCREVVEAIENLAKEKLDALQKAEDFLSAIDEIELEEEDLPHANSWQEEVSCDRSGLQTLFVSHSLVDPAMDEKPVEH